MCNIENYIKIHKYKKNGPFSWKRLFKEDRFESLEDKENDVFSIDLKFTNN